jgi:hypothetical protein
MQDIFSDVVVVMRQAVFEGLPQNLKTFLVVDSSESRNAPEALAFFFKHYRWYEEANADIMALLEHLEGTSTEDYSIREAVILRQRPYGSGCNKGHYFGPFEVYYVPRLILTNV